MSNFERFSQYWNEAVNGLVYGINCAPAGILTKDQIQQIWTEELLNKRFFSQGVLHGSRTFLDELESQEPETAKKVRERLQQSDMPFGLDGSEIVLTAGGAGASALAGLKTKKGPLKALFLAVSAGLAAGAVARSVNRGGKTALTRAVKQEAARQLEAYQDLLGDQ